MRFLNKYFAEEKHLRHLELEARRLEQAQFHAPIVPLPRPYQRGWVKTYVLQNHLAQRSGGEVFRSILKVINQRVYSRHRSFIDRSGRPIVLRPRIIEVREWLRLGWPASHQRYFSYGSWRLEDRPWLPAQQRRCISGFKLFYDWWLREDVQPHLITHQRVELPKVRSRLAEIESYMARTCGWNRLNRIHGRSRWWRRFESRAADERERLELKEQIGHVESDT